MGMKLSYRSGTSFARGTTIDAHLPEELNDKLYKLWNNAWGEPFGFHGGIKAITCEMVLEAPKSEFLKTMGDEDGNRVWSIATSYAGR